MRTEHYTFLDDAVCRIRLEFVARHVFLHCKPFAGPRRVVRRLFEIRESLAGVLRAIGYVRVHVLFRENPRLQRLCRRLGFVTVRQRRGWVYMEADNHA